MIFRFHFRANIKNDFTVDSSCVKRAISDCSENIETLKKEGKILSASLFYADRMLFLYYEGIGEEVKKEEPLGSDICGWEKPEHFECGEELYTTAVKPNDFMAPLYDYLEKWPGQSSERLWVYMYHIYYHALPTDVDFWMKDRHPDRKRGRIAFLRTDKVFSYVFFHKALVDEGLIKGDKYMSIALHENILFSYFEEPRSSVNLSGRYEPSAVINDYLAAGDRDHFIHMDEGNGENFMLLPDLFTI